MATKKAGRAGGRGPTPSQRRAEREAAARAKAAQARRQRTRRLLIGGILLAAITAVVIVVVLATKGPRTIRPGAVQVVESPTAQIVPQNAAEDESSLIVTPWASGAALTVDIHLDYQCPPCRVLEQTIGPALEELAARGQILLRYHVRSWMDSWYGGDQSRTAAIAATCADVAGAFPAYQRAVFATDPDDQHGYADQTLRDGIAQRAGLRGPALTSFQTCLDNRATADFVERMEDLNWNTPVPVPDRVDFDEGVRQSPAFFVNGVWIENPEDVPLTGSADVLAFLRQAAGLG